MPLIKHYLTRYRDFYYIIRPSVDVNEPLERICMYMCVNDGDVWISNDKRMYDEHDKIEAYLTRKIIDNYGEHPNRQKITGLAFYTPKNKELCTA